MLKFFIIFLYSSGDVAKLVYVLKSNGTIQSSTRLPQLNASDIQAKLQADLITARYSVVTDVTTLVAYEQHFQLTLTQPLLQVDRVAIQSQLEEAWAMSKNGTLLTIYTNHYNISDFVFQMTKKLFACA